MPLFMDLHDASDYDVKPTVEEIKKNHIADLSVQAKHGVKFIQYWINEDAGMVFCLMEAPNKEACSAVHQEAHGAMPCKIIELKGGDYSAFIENAGHVNTYDIVEDEDGKLDKAYRIIVTVDILSRLPGHAMDNILNQFSSDARIVEISNNRRVLSFVSTQSAIEFVEGLKNQLQKSEEGEWRIGIAAGSPVTNEDVLYGEAIALSEILNEMAGTKQVFVNSLAISLGAGAFDKQNPSIRIISKKDESFARNFYQNLKSTIFNTDFNIDVLSHSIGMSRSAMYRRIVSITGTSPNEIVQEMRLRKGYNLLLEGESNVTQVAYEVGYSNPSYFTKKFQERFHLSPMRVRKAGE